MICKSCGKELADDSKFCIQCGKDPSAEAPTAQPAAPPAAAAPSETKPAKKPFNKKALIGIAAGVVVLLIIIIAAASGGGGKGSLKGEWVPVGGSGSYQSLKFSGSNVTLDSGYGGAMTGKYTYKNNTLTVTVQGYPIELPLEMGKVGKVDVLLIGGVKYAHPKDVDKVAGAEAGGEGNFEGADKPTEAVNNANNDKDPIFEQFAKLPKVTVAHKMEDRIVSGYIVQNGNLYKTGWGGDPDGTPILTDVKLFRDGNRTYFAVKANGELWAFGSNNQGLLGDGTGVDRTDPVKIMDGVLDVMTIEANNYLQFPYALKTDNTLWRWGNGIFAPEQIAEGVADILKYPDRENKGAAYHKPNGDIVVDGKLVINNVKEVVTYSDYNSYYTLPSVLILSDNAAYSFPQLANGNLEHTKIYDNAKSVFVLDMQNPANGSVIVTNSGELMGKGDNAQGQFGDGTKVPKTDWVKLADGVASYGGEYALENTRYNYHYIKADGSVWAWTSADPTARQIVPPTVAVTTPATEPAEGAATAAAGAEGFPSLPDPS